MFSLSKAQEPLEVDGYRIRVKRHSLWGYVGKITVNPTIEHVKIVAIREATSRELVPQSSSSSGTDISPMEYEGNRSRSL